MQDDGSKKRGPKPQHNEEFKASAVGLVLDQGMSADQVFKDLGITKSTFYRWLKEARIARGDAAPSSKLSPDERQRLTELEAENRQLRLERELLKKWAAFFAKETSK